MKVNCVLPVILAAFLISAACERSRVHNFDDEFIVSKSTLADSLSLKTIQAMQVKEISGISIDIQSKNQRVHYYEYEGDKSVVLKAISRTGFSIDGAVADTVCRNIPFENLTHLRSTLQADELDRSKFFWQVNEKGVDVYECIKAPVRHTLVFRKDSKTILHRIEIG